jgi:branched-chain amino acid aminotransferase
MAGAYDDRDGMIWMDGKLVDWRSANVHILTHALHYASSVFEGERCYNGRIFKMREHSERLKFSANCLDFEIPYTVEEIDAAKEAVLQANNLTDAYVRAIAWRGAGEDMGVSARRNPVRMAVAVWGWGNYYGDAKMKGAKLDIAKWRRPDPATIPHQAKAAGLYMICTLSKHAAEAAGYNDAMMLDWRGQVAEATGANIFFLKDGELHTPTPDCFLDGITRRSLIALAQRRGIKVVERAIWPEELGSFQEAFLTGSAAEVTPLAEIGPWSFQVGETTLQLAQDYNDLVHGRITGVEPVPSTQR